MQNKTKKKHLSVFDPNLDQIGVISVLNSQESRVRRRLQACIYKNLLHHRRHESNSKYITTIKYGVKYTVLLMRVLMCEERHKSSQRGANRTEEWQDFRAGRDAELRCLQKVKMCLLLLQQRLYRY